MPDLVSRFDEGTPDIMVSDNAEFKGNAGFLGIANGRGHTRIRHRNDNVRIDVAFARQFGSDTFPDVINIATFQMTVGTGKIDILKNILERLFVALAIMVKKLFVMLILVVWKRAVV